MIKIRKHREIFNRKEQAVKLDALKEEYRADQIRVPFLSLLKETYASGFEVIRKRADEGETGVNLANTQSFLTDEIIHMIYEIIFFCN